MAVETAPEAGWYDEDTSPSGQRYWDGKAWTSLVSPLDLPAPKPAPSTKSRTAAQLSPASLDAISTVREAPPAPSPDAAAAPSRNLPARWALGAAIASLAISFFAVLPTIALVLGVVGLVRAQQIQQWTGAAIGRASSIWAICLSIVGLVFFLSLQLPGLIAAAVPTFDKAAVEAEILSQSADQGVSFSSVECPTSPSMEEGNEFQCVATLPDESVVTVNVRIQDDEGSYTWDLNPFK